MKPWAQFKMIDTIILDLDGPLLDGRLRHYSCYSSILKEHGFEPLEINAYWKDKRSRLDRRRVLGKSNAAEFYDGFLLEWLRRIELPAMLALDRLQPDALSILSAWKEFKVQLVIATMRNHAKNTEDQLRSLGILPLVDDVFVTGSDDGYLGKVEAVRNSLSGKRCETALWVGDTEVDIYAARSLGVRVCALTCGLRNHTLLASENPDVLLEDLRAVRSYVDQIRQSTARIVVDEQR